MELECPYFPCKKEKMLLIVTTRYSYGFHIDGKGSDTRYWYCPKCQRRYKVLTRYEEVKE